MNAPDYNASQLSAGHLTARHITELVRHWQAAAGLEVDGKAGPKTIASIEAQQPVIVYEHWLVGPDVKSIPADASWYGGPLQPKGIVAHYTATDPGTAVNMAKRRSHPFNSDPDNRLASWHVTIETDGTVVQMVPFHRMAWHAGSSTAKQIDGLGWANSTCIGIELVGPGDAFPPAQVEAAKRVWRAIVQAYSIPHKYAMLEHSAIDPTRRSDPGPTWMRQHATDVLEAAYG